MTNSFPTRRSADLLEDRGGERREAEHRECAVLGQQVHADEQSAAQDGEAKLRQHHAPEHCRRAGTERAGGFLDRRVETRSAEHTSELQSLMRISYAVFCLKKNNI